MPLIRDLAINAVNGVFGFFFYRESSRKVAFFRILLGLMVIVVALGWIGNVRLLFTDNGYFTGQLIQSIYPPERVSLFFYLRDPSFIQVCYWLLLLAAGCFAAGVYSRWAAVIMYVLLVSFFSRNPLLGYGGSDILQILCLWSCFLQTDKALVPKWYAAKYGLAETVPGWPLRMIQIQLAMVYLFAAFSKIRSLDWNAGEVAYYILIYPNFSYYDFYWLRHFRALIILIGYSVIFAELTFPFWIWLPQTRRFILAVLVSMHVGFAFLINVHYFSEIMLVGLTVFLSAQEAEWILAGAGKAVERLRQGFQRRRALAA